MKNIELLHKKKNVTIKSSKEENKIIYQSCVSDRLKREKQILIEKICIKLKELSLIYNYLGDYKKCLKNVEMLGEYHKALNKEEIIELCDISNTAGICSF